MTNSADSPAIRLRGVRHNNLKNFDLDLPIGQLIVLTGLSGSGKSSLAFDTLFAEGQRRYIETFSPYARQFFDRMDKPQVDRIDAIPPAIAIEQRNSVRSTRSTVGTMTELCDYMKLVWPRFAQLYCRQCGQPVRQESPQAIWDAFVSGLERQRAELLITFELRLSEKLSHLESLTLIGKQGYQRLLLGTEILHLEEAVSRLNSGDGKGLPLTSLTVIQDRLRPIISNRARFVEACEQAYHFGKGKLTIFEIGVDPQTEQARIGNPKRFSNRLHCAACDLEYGEPSSTLFSFNHPVGACPACKGFGRIITIDYDRALPDRSRTLARGCVKPWQTGHGLESQRDLMVFCKARGIPTNLPFEKLSHEQQQWVICGDPDYGKDEEHEWPRAWYGVRGYFRWLESKAYKMHVRVLLSRYRAYSTCPDCAGKRFRPDALLYRVTLPVPDEGSTPASLLVPCVTSQTMDRPSKEGPGPGRALRQFSLADFYQLPVERALSFIEQMATPEFFKSSDPIALVLNEVRSRLRYLDDVGLGYLTLDRPTRTLSGGETERVNLTTCLGTGLVNTLFVLDEPSVGLHPRDTLRLVGILKNLRDTGNTVVVVEHEASVIRAADQIVDLGPGQGDAGGEVVFQGSFNALLKSGSSLTGQYLSGRKQIELPHRRPVLHLVERGLITAPPPARDANRISEENEPCQLNDAAASPVANSDWLIIRNAARNNLKNLAVAIPLHRLVCLTGVSGSGKTTLVRDVLLPALETHLRLPATVPKKASDDLDNDSLDEEASLVRAAQLASSISGWQSLDQVVLVDQSRLGKTPRSNPVVYIGAFDDVRDLFARTDLAKQRGLNASAFSFNSSQGQCERCRGAGFEKIEMQFLSDVFIRCPDCNGRRYREHILEIKLNADGREWSVADLLEATVDEAVRFLRNFLHLPAARRAVGSLSLLGEVGLGYLRLGQPLNTLSGGESQRLKLVSHLAESAAGDAPLPEKKPSKRESKGSSSRPPSPSTGRTRQSLDPAEPSSRRHRLFLFDEPTTGLHFEDVRVLLKVFQRLVDAGHSLLVIEHNLEVIKSADWLIELGPEAGERGGALVVCGTPEEVSRCEESHTARFLRDLLSAANSRASAKKWRNEVERRDFRALASSPLDSVAAARSASHASHITITGVREHNLKNLSIEIPRGQFVVVTGVSGSGKSTLAFDVIFAEGQRRFLDSMNTYARQFVEQLARPNVDLITGLPPTVSIEQRTTRGGGKSTVATVTEVYHFLRLLFARLGRQYCPDCHQPVAAQTRDQLFAGLEREMKKRGQLLLLAPVIRNRKGFHSEVADWAAKHGYAEIRADKKIYSTGQAFRLDRFKEHDVEIVVGILHGKTPRAGHGLLAAFGSRPGQKRRAGESTPRPEKRPQQLVAEALELGRGTLFALDEEGEVTIHSTERACPKCARSFGALDPKMFSYNSPQGWCPQCRGFGELFYLPDVERGANADSIEESWWSWQEESRETCPECRGSRLNAVARAVRLPLSFKSARSHPARVAPSTAPRDDGSGGGTSGSTIDDFSSLAVETAGRFFRRLRLKGRDALIARDILPEIRERLKFLDEVGLGYLQLGRGVTTLSGGEAQRIRLAAQLGSNLSGVLYVLDEPTIGLHARDNEQLLSALHALQARGNSLLVVEHDEETMRHADHIIDLGPGAGVHGGQLVASGTLAELMAHENSITGRCLRAAASKKYPARGQRRPVGGEAHHPSRGRKKSLGPIPSVHPRHPRQPQAGDVSHWLTLHHASTHNLKDVTVHFPLNRFVLVTGVSGSGKSTLIRECLRPALEEALKSKRAKSPSRSRGPRIRAVTGHDSLKAVYEVDQSPIGRTPRSTPATYVGFFDEIRHLFAQTPEARMRGYSASRFSFNSTQGRCPQCEGAGLIKLVMNFLPPAFVRCESCGGSRFGRETLDIQYAGKTIAQVLDLSVEEAIRFFANHKKILRPLQALHDTGLDYLKLGQTSPTLSGGEAQRVKLVTHLLTGLKEQPELLDPRHPRPKRNLFILEEPTIGLHMADVQRLVEVLQRLVDSGHSVIVIEHNLDLIAEADWVIDLGPEGGDAGGKVVGQGTPEEIAKIRGSHTGRYLRQLFKKAGAALHDIRRPARTFTLKA